MIAIGDVHGCSEALDALLRAVKPAADDTLVLLGDCIDRGPDSRGVLDRLLDESQRCRLIFVLGNHEEMLLRARNDPASLPGWLNCGGAATLDSYGFGVGPADLPADHWRLLEAGVDYYETSTHVFTHANYDPNVPFEEQRAFALRWESLRDRVPPRHVSGKTVVLGHTPQEEGKILDRGYLKCIDTECYAGGWLTALDVRSGRLWQADREGKMREGSSQ